MNKDKLLQTLRKNEVPLTNSETYQRNPPYYYDSLRAAFESYFNTFISKNFGYHFYATGLHDRGIDVYQYQTLDEENTVNSIIHFQRFFELFIKFLLTKADERLLYVSTVKNQSVQDYITLLDNAVESNPNSAIGFHEAFTRFTGLIKLSQDKSVDHTIVKSFKQVIEPYQFLLATGNLSGIEVMNHLRNKIMHSGSSLPNMWFLDYFITQHIVPIIFHITAIDKDTIGNTLFYLKTLSGNNILEGLNNIKFNYADLHNQTHRDAIYRKLLHIGHLKEQGRANLNMNMYVRENRATYEMNYRDPLGRGKRFADAERVHGHFKAIKTCPCCTNQSLVAYGFSIDDIFKPGSRLKISWIKCYTCEFHLHSNMHEPMIFGLAKENVFF